jgi:uncharacterized protein (DUF697 family)
VNVTKAVEAWKQSLAAASRSAGVVLGGDERNVALARQHFASGGTVPAGWTGALSELSGLSTVQGELLVVFVTPGGEPEALMALERGVPKGGVVLAVDEGGTATGRASSPRERVVRLSFSDTPRHWRRLFDACAEVAGDDVVALGRRYPVLRRQAARRVIYKTAAQNALIGATFFVPGADMPAMTLNQAKMVLSLAGIYGAPIDRERAVELAGLVGVGLGMRALARSFVRSTPGLGWVVKASTGFTGTVAVGYAALRYFERGAPGATSKVLALVAPLRR